MSDTWLFDQPPNAAAITSKHITFEKKPILLVTHYADDHSWAFLSGEIVSVTEAQVLSMQEIVHIDPTLIQIADLPPGWSANRACIGGGWNRYETDT